MEITKEMLNKDRIEMDIIIIKTYGKNSQQYRDMMFAINIYYQGLLRYIDV